MLDLGSSCFGMRLPVGESAAAGFVEGMGRMVARVHVEHWGRHVSLTALVAFVDALHEVIDGVLVAVPGELSGENPLHKVAADY